MNLRDDLGEQFLGLQHVGYREGLWPSFTRGGYLFRALKQLIGKGELPAASEQWVAACQKKFPIDERHWKAVHSLVWCALRAQEDPKSFQADIERPIRELARDLPSFVTGGKTWAWGCIRALLDLPIKGRTVKVAVALVDKREGDRDRPGNTPVAVDLAADGSAGRLEYEGWIAQFELEILEHGGGEIYHHAIDALDADSDPEFRHSMIDAWEAAKNLAKFEGVHGTFEGRWRLLDTNGNPVLGVKGRSASGAAALGWYHALKGTIPDEGIIVLAQIDSSGTLSEVDKDGIEAKVRAIEKYGQFDTIAVAGKDNENAALKALSQGTSIRVKNLE